MQLEPDFVRRIVEEAALPSYREIAENPLLCMLLLHVLVRHGFAGPQELLRYLARDIEVTKAA